MHQPPKLKAQYDQFANPRKIWDAKGNQSQIEYSSQYAYAYPTLSRTAVPDPSGQYGASVGFVTTSTYDFSTGVLTATVDANNVTTTLEYNDVLNRPSRMVRASGTSVQNQTSIGYDDVNRVVTTTSDQNAYNDNLLLSKVLYDGLGRTTETRQYEGGANYIAVQQEYDALRRAFNTSNPFRPWQNETPVWTTAGFDALGRVVSVTSPGDAVVSTAYSGTTVTVTDQSGKKRRSVTDALARLVRVDEPDDNNNLDVSGAPFQSTSYGYDTLNNLRSVTQGAQSPRLFVYDSLKRLTSATNPESGAIAYDYDDNGNLAHKTDARGIASTYRYDGLNRNTNVVYTNDPANTPAVTRRYDGAPNGKGKLWKTDTAGSTGARTTINSFDTLGGPTSQSQQFYASGAWSQPYTVQRSYDLANHVRTQTYPSGHAVNYPFDSAGRLSSFSGNLGEGVQRTYANEFQYTAFGATQQERFGTDTALHHKQRYNARGQI